MLEGGQPSPRRLPFTLHATGAVGRLTLADLTIGPLTLDLLELEVDAVEAEATAEKFQRRRSRLRALAVRISAAAIDERIAAVRRQLASLGVTGVSARISDGFVSVRARATDGLAAAELSFHVQLVSAGTHVRALVTTVRVHGHLPTPGPVIADRILGAVLGATDAAGVIERPHARGLCDVETDLVGALLWHLLPPNGWRLPAVADVELTHVRVGRQTIAIGYGPVGSRGGDLGVRAQAQQVATAHDLMHSVDALLRDGQLEDAMRGYRALLAAGGPDQPLLLERILALAAARPAWFFDGLELARQALGRWPRFAAAHAALGSITLAQGDAREAANQLGQVAQLASADGDDDQAALAALAAARLLRVLDPRAATQLYQLALEHDPGSAEAADALADRLADEQRWPELVRLVRARAVVTPDHARAVALRLRLADVFVRQMGDVAGAQRELDAARQLAPGDPAVHEMTATILSASDPTAAGAAWREVARLADERGDHRTSARAWAMIGQLAPGDDAEAAWQRALELDPLQADALAGLAAAATQRGDAATAAELYERLRGLGLPPHTAARHELALARCLVSLGRVDEARNSLRRATAGGGETAAEAHAVLAAIADTAGDRDHAADELDTAIAALLELARGDLGGGDRLHARAAELGAQRAELLDRAGLPAAAAAEWQRAHALGVAYAPAIARTAARTLLERATADPAAEQRWIDAVLATDPPPGVAATLLARRADARRRQPEPDLAAALADVRAALAALDPLVVHDQDPDTTVATRRRAHALAAELHAITGDLRARAQAVSALAELATSNTAEHAQDAAVAWLAADDPAAALAHARHAYAALADAAPQARGAVLTTFGEAAWRQRAWVDVIRAYQELVAEPPGDPASAARAPIHRYRLAVAADRNGDAVLALATLRPFVADPPRDGEGEDDGDGDALGGSELRGPALRLYADLAERAGELADAAGALERFAAIGGDGSASTRADGLYRAGELFRRADRSDEAVRCLEAALRLSDAHLPALDALEMAWRERGDLERVAVILGRKVAATARQPGRQKPLLSRLGDLQAQLGRPDVALATHQRALEIDASWRPSLRYATQYARERGELAAAARGLAQLAGELPSDATADPAAVGRERATAMIALGAVVADLPELDTAGLAAARELALPVLERASAELRDGELAPAFARLRGEPATTGSAIEPAADRDAREHEPTQSGRAPGSAASATALRDAASRARAAGKLADALATLETANHLEPGDPGVLRELVELAAAHGDHAAAARHLAALAAVLTGSRRGDALLELADIAYDRLDEPVRARAAMRAGADAFGPGSRHDATLRLLAAEASAHLAWDVVVDALAAIAPERRLASDLRQLALALTRAGRDADAVAAIDDPSAERRLDDGGELLASLRAELARKTALAAALEQRAAAVAEDAPASPEATALAAEATVLRLAVRTVEPDAATSLPRIAVTDELVESERPIVGPPPPPPSRASSREIPVRPPSVVVSGTPDETLAAVTAAAASADRDRLIAAHRAAPNDAALLAAVLVHLGDREPGLRRNLLESVAQLSTGRAQAIALHELALIARAQAHDPIRSAGLLTKAHRVDPGYAPVWLPLADALVAADDLDAARALYARIAASSEIDAERRAWAADRVTALDREPDDDDAIVSGEFDVLTPPVRLVPAGEAPAPPAASAASAVVVAPLIPPPPDPVATPAAELAHARELADQEQWRAAIVVAERAAAIAAPGDTTALELLEQLYIAAGDAIAASEAIGRQLVIAPQPAQRAQLWRRRARLYREVLGREAEAYRCLKEAHACAPADPDTAYQLRAAAMVRGEWALVASLLYREVAAAKDPRDRGALHLELALVYDERLADPAQAQINLEQALAFDPTIPAAHAPLARRYEALGRFDEAATLYDGAATHARAGDRAALLDAAVRCRATTTGTAAPPPDEASAPEPPAPPDAPPLGQQLDAAEAAGDTERARDLARQLWHDAPGDPEAYRVLAASCRVDGDLAAATELALAQLPHTAAPEARAGLWLDVAKLAEDIGELEAAARAYDHALIEDPGHATALDARGALAFTIGDFAAADLIYRDLAPGESVLGEDDLADRRSQIAERLGRDSDALALAQVAVAAAPGRRDLLERVVELASRLGEMGIALGAAHGLLDLVALDDGDGLLAAQLNLVELSRRAGDLDAAIAELERVVRDHPQHAGAIETLADVHVARGDWTAATRYLYQLVPLAPSPADRADRLYRLGEAVLIHLGDVDRADDVFLRASDLDPGHIPTLRRLLDVYWRADDPAALVEVATELAASGALGVGRIAASSVAQALIAAALIGDTALASTLATALGDDTASYVVGALIELATRDGRLQLGSAATAISELARRGVLDLARLRAASAGTPAAPALAAD